MVSVKSVLEHACCFARLLPCVCGFVQEAGYPVFQYCLCGEDGACLVCG